MRVLSKPEYLGSADLWDLPVQIISIPWIGRSGLMAAVDINGISTEEIFLDIESRLTDLVEGWLEDADPDLPMILTAHASVQGATFGSERMVMLGADLVLPEKLVKDERLDYVALGHIHKPQDLNTGGHHPVIYPGSIERVDFGEAQDPRFFVIADIQKHKTTVEWRKIEGVRPFLECWALLESPENVTETLRSALPKEKDVEGAIIKLTVEYPRDFDPLIDESALRKYTEKAFEFHLVKRPQTEARVRLPPGQTVSSMSPMDLLDQYWRAIKMDEHEIESLRVLAAQIVADRPDESVGK